MLRDRLGCLTMRQGVFACFLLLWQQVLCERLDLNATYGEKANPLVLNSPYRYVVKTETQPPDDTLLDDVISPQPEFENSPQQEKGSLTDFYSNNALDASLGGNVASLYSQDSTKNQWQSPFSRVYPVAVDSSFKRLVEAAAVSSPRIEALSYSRYAPEEEDFTSILSALPIHEVKSIQAYSTIENPDPENVINVGPKTWSPSKKEAAKSNQLVLNSPYRYVVKTETQPPDDTLLDDVISPQPEGENSPQQEEGSLTDVYANSALDALLGADVASLYSQDSTKNQWQSPFSRVDPVAVDSSFKGLVEAAAVSGPRLEASSYSRYASEEEGDSDLTSILSALPVHEVKSIQAYSTMENPDPENVIKVGPKTWSPLKKEAEESINSTYLTKLLRGFYGTSNSENIQKVGVTSRCERADADSESGPVLGPDGLLLYSEPHGVRNEEDKAKEPTRVEENGNLSEKYLRTFVDNYSKDDEDDNSKDDEDKDDNDVLFFPFLVDENGHISIKDSDKRGSEMSSKSLYSRTDGAEDGKLHGDDGADGEDVAENSAEKGDRDDKDVITSYSGPEKVKDQKSVDDKNIFQSKESIKTVNVSNKTQNTSFEEETNEEGFSSSNGHEDDSSHINRGRGLNQGSPVDKKNLVVPPKMMPLNHLFPNVWNNFIYIKDNQFLNQRGLYNHLGSGVLQQPGRYRSMRLGGPQQPDFYPQFPPASEKYKPRSLPGRSFSKQKHSIPKDYPKNKRILEEHKSSGTQPVKDTDPGMQQDEPIPSFRAWQGETPHLPPAISLTERHPFSQRRRYHGYDPVSLADAPYKPENPLNPSSRSVESYDWLDPNSIVLNSLDSMKRYASSQWKGAPLYSPWTRQEK